MKETRAMRLELQDTHERIAVRNEDMEIFMNDME